MTEHLIRLERERLIDREHRRRDVRANQLGGLGRQQRRGPAVPPSRRFLLCRLSNCYRVLWVTKQRWAHVAVRATLNIEWKLTGRGALTTIKHGHSMGADAVQRGSLASLNPSRLTVAEPGNDRSDGTS